jgi:hypothetical protein
MPRIIYEKLTVTPDKGHMDFLRHPSSVDVYTATIHSERSPSEGEPDEHNHTLFQMGMGNGGARVRKATASRLGAMGIHGLTLVDALPFWKAESDPESLLAFASYVTDAVALHLQEEHNVDTLHAIGESQGSVPVLESMRQPKSPLNGRLGLVHPLGLTPDILTVPRFGARMLQTAMQNDIELTGTMVAANAAKRAIGDLLYTRGQQMTSAIGYDGITPLSEILKSHEVGIFTGEDDRLFPSDEVNRSLGEAGVSGYKYDIGEGAHAAPGTRIGAKLANRACFWVQNGIFLPQEQPSQMQLRFGIAPPSAE